MARSLFAVPIVASVVCLLSFPHVSLAQLIDDVTNPGDATVPVDLDGTSSSPAAEESPLAIDDVISTKYLNFGEQNAGFIVTPTNNPDTHAVRSLTITTANDAEARDPASFAIYGTNFPIVSGENSDGSGEPWSLIATGGVSLPSSRNTVGPTVEFPNDTYYDSFRVIFPTVKDPGAANSVQIAEIQLEANNIGSAQAAVLPIPDVTNNGDLSIPIDLDGTGSSSPGAEQAPLAVDNLVTTKYLNFGEENAGLIVRPSLNPVTHAVTSLTVTTANDAEARDPTSYQLFGTNDVITSAAHSDGSGEDWSLIAEGALDLPSDRNTVGPTVTFDNDQHYGAFRVVFPTVKDAAAANSVQIAEVQLNATEALLPTGDIADMTQFGDVVIPIDLDGTGSSSPAAEQAFLAIDNLVTTKYLNFGEENAGFIVTPSLNPDTHAATSLTVWTANDAEARDPTSFQLFGTNDPISSLPHSDGSDESWTLIAAGALDLPSARNTEGPTVFFENDQFFESFRVVFPTVKDAAAANSVQIAEFELGATLSAVIPEPASVTLWSLCGVMLTQLGKRRRK